MLIVPATVVPTPLIVRLPVPDLVKFFPASVPAMMLPKITVLPAPPMASVRGREAVEPSGMVRLPVKVRLPPMLLVKVVVIPVVDVLASEANVVMVTPKPLRLLKVVVLVLPVPLAF